MYPKLFNLEPPHRNTAVAWLHHAWLHHAWLCCCNSYIHLFIIVLKWPRYVLWKSSLRQSGLITKSAQSGTMVAVLSLNSFTHSFSFSLLIPTLLITKTNQLTLAFIHCHKMIHSNANRQTYLYRASRILKWLLSCRCSRPTQQRIFQLNFCGSSS